MEYQIYILKDPEAIGYIVNDDIDALEEAIANGLAPDFDVETFNSEAEALAFCAGLGYDADERAIPAVYPLRSFEPVDVPYIALIEDCC